VKSTDGVASHRARILSFKVAAGQVAPISRRETEYQWLRKNGIKGRVMVVVTWTSWLLMHE